MPYIHPDERQAINRWIDPMFHTPHGDDTPVVCTEGQLNYAITRLVHNWCQQHSALDRGYRMYNAAVGVLECAKQEFYAKIVRPYEEKKREENGIVTAYG
jgi:hypothetical protein